MINNLATELSLDLSTPEVLVHFLNIFPEEWKRVTRGLAIAGRATRYDRDVRARALWQLRYGDFVKQVASGRRRANPRGSHVWRRFASGYFHFGGERAFPLGVFT